MLKIININQNFNENCLKICQSNLSKITKIIKNYKKIILHCGIEESIDWWPVDKIKFFAIDNGIFCISNPTNNHHYNDTTWNQYIRLEYHNSYQKHHTPNHDIKAFWKCKVKKIIQQSNVIRKVVQNFTRRIFIKEYYFTSNHSFSHFRVNSFITFHNRKGLEIVLNQMEPSISQT